MTNAQFQQLTTKHSLSDELLYNSNALAGEVGECANLTKKIYMATTRPDWVERNEERLRLLTKEQFTEQLKDELGDALFYLTRLANLIGVSLEELMKTQASKLSEKSITYGRIFLK